MERMLRGGQSVLSVHFCNCRLFWCCCDTGANVNCETGANGTNLTPNFGTQGEKSGLAWTQIWTQFDGNFRPPSALI